MPRLCERPGCSEPGAAAYGMVPEDLLFWIAPLRDAPVSDPSVLCRRHADTMVVPRGWTLDDLRDEFPRLFRPVPAEGDRVHRPKRARNRRPGGGGSAMPVQLQIDGTGEIDRPVAIGDVDAGADVAADGTVGAVPPTSGRDGADEGTAEVVDSGYEPWQPDFDSGDDLDGLLGVQSPLLARAFRGTDRPRR